jgi:hypothetical protein
VICLWSVILGLVLFSLIVYFCIKDYKMKKHLKKHPFSSPKPHDDSTLTTEQQIEVEKQKSYRSFGSGPM